MPEQVRGPAFELHRRVLEEVALRGWTKTELRQQTGVARSTVEAWATQPRPPQPRTVNAVADALGIDRTEALQLAGILGATAVRDEQLSPLDAFEEAVVGADLPDAEKAAAIRRHRDQIREQLTRLGIDPPPAFLRGGVRHLSGESASSDEARGA